MARPRKKPVQQEEVVLEGQNQSPPAIPEGFKLVPEDFVVLPREVYEDLLHREPPAKSAIRDKKEELPECQYLRVLRRVYIGDCRVTLQKDDVIEYYPRRKFVVRGKSYEQLTSLLHLINSQKRTGREYFEKITQSSDLATDSWGEVVMADDPLSESNEDYKERVQKEERAQPQLSRKEMIANIGKQTPTNRHQEVKATIEEVSDGLPPRGSEARKQLIARSGMRNVDTLAGTKPEKISDIKVLNTSRDSRVVARIRGQAALDTTVKENPLG